MLKKSKKESGKEVSKNIKLSPPWVTYCRQIEAMFGEDPDVIVESNEEERTITLMVKGNEKASAIESLLPNKKDFGNESVSIFVIPMDSKDWLPIDVYRKAFEGNQAVSFITSVEDVFTNPIYYIVFKKEVVQFYNDNMADIHGLTSTLYQDIAKEIFENKKGVNFCTDF